MVFAKHCTLAHSRHSVSEEEDVGRQALPMGNTGLGGYRAGREAASVTALGQGQQPRSR